MVWLTWTGVLAPQVMQIEKLCAAKKEQRRSAQVGAREEEHVGEMDARAVRPTFCHTSRPCLMADDPLTCAARGVYACGCGSGDVQTKKRLAAHVMALVTVTWWGQGMLW